MNILITICGRAGSKGLRNKNFKDFLGYPLLFYTLAAAALFKERHPNDQVDIGVNSDSEELLSLARKWADVTAIPRPAELAQDQSPKIPVIRHSLSTMETVKKCRYDYIIDLDITSPCRRVADIENAYQKISQSTKSDIVFSAVNARRNPYFNMVELRDGRIQRVKSSDFVARQQAPAVYDVNASIYCYKRDSLLKTIKESLFDGVCDVILMKDTAVIDIDSEEDFELLQILGKHFFEHDFVEIMTYLRKHC